MFSLLGFGSWISNSKLDKQSGKRFYSFLKDTKIPIPRICKSSERRAVVQDPGAGADYGMREAGTGNIGSIITMLIDEGNTVDIDDILTEEQCRQSQCSQEGSGGSHQVRTMY